MALNYEFNATAGGATATSYVEVSAADFYLASRPDAEGWSDLTEGQKQQYLMAASRDIDSLNFLYEKYSQVEEGRDGYQRLKFPCRVQSRAYIPEAVQAAVCVQALHIMRHAGRHDAAAELVEQGYNRAAVAGLNLDIGNRPHSNVCPEARRFLSAWLSRKVELKGA